MTMRRWRLAVGALLLGAVLGAQDRAQHAPAPAGATSATGAAPSRTRVIMLGTGSPAPNPERSGPAVVVLVDETAYLVDCGPGVVRRLAAAGLAHRLPALFPARPRHVFLTHLHSDHTLGCPDLLLSGWTLGRRVPLRVWGPEGTERMFHHITEAYRADIEHRTSGLEPSNATGYRAEVSEIDAGVIYEDSLVRVTAVAVRHGEWAQAFGYRFDTPDRRIVISGDAAYSESLAAACSGCDVLIHEVMSPRDVDALTPEWRRYHRAYHTMSDELGRLATRASPKLLVLYHISDREVPADTLVREVQAGFQGRVVAARDLDVF